MMEDNEEPKKDNGIYSIKLPITIKVTYGDLVRELAKEVEGKKLTDKEIDDYGRN